MTRQLAQRPSIAHLHKEAKKLLHKCRANDSAAIENVLSHSTHSPRGASNASEVIRLCDTQRATAHDYGFNSWESLIAHAQALIHPGSTIFSPFDDPRFEEISYRQEVARSIGLPQIGSTKVSRHGVKYTVTDYQPVATPTRAARLSGGGLRWTLDDLLPIVILQEMSPRLNSFCIETDLVTTKNMTFLDTVPKLRPDLAAPGVHQVSCMRDSDSLEFLFDAQDLHETIVAHELGHTWIEEVDGIEDHRHLRDQWNTARISQFQHIQSFALDLRVNELLKLRGFDMSIITNHQLEAIENIALNCAIGRPFRTIRAAAGMINVLASAMIEQRALVDMGAINICHQLEVIEVRMPAVYEAAVKFVDTVDRNGYHSADAIRHVVDDCAILSFGLCGESFSPDRDLIEIPPAKSIADKHPEILDDLPAEAKLQVYRAAAKLGIVGREQYNWTVSPTGRCDLIMTTRTGEPIEPVNLTFQASREVVRKLHNPGHGTDHRPGWGGRQISQPGLPVGNLRKYLPMQAANPALHNPTAAINGAHAPAHMGTVNSNIPRRQGVQEHRPKSGSNTLPNPVSGGPYNRSYSAGLGLWLSQVGFEQLALGEQPYGYANNSPITITDPSGLFPCSPSDDECGTCLTHPGGPCGYAKCKKDDRGQYGGVVCCEGVKYACAWKSPGPRSGMTQCVKEHEGTHKGQVSCPDHGYVRPPWDYPKDESINECYAYVVGTGCLERQEKKECSSKKLTEDQKKVCHKDYDDRICADCWIMRTDYNCPSFPARCGKCKGWNY